MAESKTTAQKLVDSTLLAAVARVSMALAIPISWGAYYAAKDWVDHRFEIQALNTEKVMAPLVNNNAAIEKRLSRVENLPAQFDQMSNRLAILETRQQETAKSTAEYQNLILNKMERFQESVNTISNAIASLSATMNAQIEYERRRAEKAGASTPPT